MSIRPTTGEPVAVELKSNQPDRRARRLGRRQSNVGIQFDSPIDVEEMLAEPGRARQWLAAAPAAGRGRPARHPARRRPPLRGQHPRHQPGRGQGRDRPADRGRPRGRPHLENSGRSPESSAGARPASPLATASTETAERLIARAVLILLQRDDLRRTLADEPALLPAFVEEVLRLFPPEPTLLREAVRPASVGGVEIKAGGQLRLSVAAANRDPSRFEAPHALRLDLPKRHHFAFGGGVHQCIGAGLGRRLALVALRTLLRRAPGLAPAEPLARACLSTTSAAGCCPGGCWSGHDWIWILRFARRGQHIVRQRSFERFYQQPRARDKPCAVRRKKAASTVRWCRGRRRTRSRFAPEARHIAPAPPLHCRSEEASARSALRRGKACRRAR